MVGLMSTSLPFSSLPSYWSGSCPQVSNFQPCLLIGLAFFHKSPIFILAFLLISLMSTCLPFSSVPSYWSGCCPQVFLFYPCILIGRALVHKSLIFILFFTIKRGDSFEDECLYIVIQNEYGQRKIRLKYIWC